MDHTEAPPDGPQQYYCNSQYWDTAPSPSQQITYAYSLPSPNYQLSPQSHHPVRTAITSHVGVPTNFNYTLLQPGPLAIRHYTPTPVPVAWSSIIPLAQPLGDNVHFPASCASVNCHEPLSPGHPACPPSFNPVDTSTGPEVVTLGVSILTPKVATNGRFPYRENVTAQITHTLNGNVPHPFGGVVLGPTTADPSQLVLVCYAECRSCTSQPSSQYRQCKPTMFYLDPVPTKRNRGFDLDKLSGTLTGNVTFKIRPRRKWPRSEDQEWRCPSEALILTYCLRDHTGNLVAKKQVETPFQARPHTKKGGPQSKPQHSEWVATPGGLSSMPSLQGAHGIPSVSFTSGSQSAAPNLPVVHAAPPFAFGY